MKHVIVILDGASGWRMEEFGGLTSLQRADTPNLDRMAREGTVGLAQTVPPGEEPSSAAACMSILGYDPASPRLGRGAIEAASMGIELPADEVALRMNLVTIEDGMMRSYAAGHITTEESTAIVTDLADALASDGVRIHPGIAYRHILVAKGHPELVDCTYIPPHDISDKPIEAHLPSGPGSEFLLDLMERARPVLANSAVNTCRCDAGDLPATDIWLFWPGMARAGLVPFAELRGVAAAMTSGVDLLNGLATLTGIDRLDIPGVTDGHDNDYGAQVEGALAALEDHDLVVVHVESPDEAGHAGDAEAKVAAISEIDRGIVARLLEHPGPMRILAMPDHPTPLALKTHTGDAVPFVLWGAGIGYNGAERFDEAQAAATDLVVDPGHGVMGMLLG